MLTLWKNQKGFALLGNLLIIVIVAVVASVAISAIGTSTRYRTIANYKHLYNKRNCSLEEVN